MAGAFVQLKANQDETGGAGGTIATGNLDSGVNSSNVLVACVVYVDSDPRTITVTGGGTWVSAATHSHDATQGNGREIFWCKAPTGGTTDVTATFSTSTPTYRSIVVAEFSGLDQVSALTGASVSGVKVSTPGTGADGVTTGNVTIGAQPAFMVGFVEDWTGGATPTAGTGFTGSTPYFDYGSATNAARMIYKRITSTSAVPFTATTTVGTDIHYIGGIVILESGGGGGGSAATPYYYERRRRG